MPSKSTPVTEASGLHGHLTEVISAEEYTTLISETAFVPADDPGVQEPHSLGATAAQIFTANTLHNNTRDDFTTYRKTQVAFNSQLLEAVDDAFVNELNNSLWSYGQVAALQLLTHLHETYDWIMPDQLDENAAMLDREWNPENPMERLWQRAREYRSFALTGSGAITEAFAVRKTQIIWRERVTSPTPPATSVNSPNSSRLGPCSRSTSK